MKRIVFEFGSLFWVLGAWLSCLCADGSEVDVGIPGVLAGGIVEEVALRVILGLDDFRAVRDLGVLVGVVRLVFGGHAVLGYFQAIASFIIDEGLVGCEVFLFFGVRFLDKIGRIFRINGIVLSLLLFGGLGVGGGGDLAGGVVTLKRKMES
jgi:hypothetical protein